MLILIFYIIYFRQKTKSLSEHFCKWFTNLQCNSQYSCFFLELTIIFSLLHLFVHFLYNLHTFSNLHSFKINIIYLLYVPFFLICTLFNPYCYPTRFKLLLFINLWRNDYSLFQTNNQHSYFEWFFVWPSSHTTFLHTIFQKR